MSTNPLHPSLLRPPVLQILRAAGFTTTRPSVLDTLVDLASRYLTLLASHTARHALLRSPTLPHQDPETLTITDVRMALQDVGALFPQLSGMEEQARGEEDMRGVEAFIGWCMGNANLEIRRVAGLAPDDSRIDLTNPTVKAGGAVDVGLEPVKEDWLTQLKKKHAKTKDGEESRWAGTVLGRDITGIREGGVKIEGWGNGGVESIEAWTERFRHKTGTAEGAVAQVEGVKAASESSSPLSEISVDAR